MAKTLRNIVLVVSILFVAFFIIDCAKRSCGGKGIKTHPKCAKYCSEEAIATCEAGIRAGRR